MFWHLLFVVLTFLLSYTPFPCHSFLVALTRRRSLAVSGGLWISLTVSGGLLWRSLVGLHRALWRCGVLWRSLVSGALWRAYTALSGAALPGAPWRSLPESSDLTRT